MHYNDLGIEVVTDRVITVRGRMMPVQDLVVNGGSIKFVVICETSDQVTNFGFDDEDTFAWRAWCPVVPCSCEWVQGDPCWCDGGVCYRESEMEVFVDDLLSYLC